ncbi:three prime repair exonuclease 4 [Stigmatopora argus]
MQTSEADDNQQQLVVFFDLETTGFGPTCELVQLAAVSGNRFVNLYTVPRRRMEAGAARVTGLRVRRRKLYLHYRPVPTSPLRDVLRSFIAFLRAFDRPLLAGHNIRRFDCRPLRRALDETGLRAELEACVGGWVDTLPLAREILEGCGMRSFKQEYLVRELMGVAYGAHDALEDVRALQTLYRVLQPKAEVVARHTFCLSDVPVVTPVVMPEVTPEVTHEVSKVPKREHLLPGQQLLWQHLERTEKDADEKAADGNATQS